MIHMHPPAVTSANATNVSQLKAILFIPFSFAEIIAKMIATPPEGTSSKNAEGFRTNIPTAWVRDLDISKEDRNVTISYKNQPNETNMKIHSGCCSSHFTDSLTFNYATVKALSFPFTA